METVGWEVWGVEVVEVSASIYKRVLVIEEIMLWIDCRNCRAV